jgi:hypothetical protein
VMKNPSNRTGPQDYLGLGAPRFASSSSGRGAFSASTM